MTNVRRVSWSLLSHEPFRVFFPVATLVGLAGVALWPLHFGGVVEFYPGQTHARLMTYGFFGGFIIGFLGTALPRMLSARPLVIAETAMLLAIYALMSWATFSGKTVQGDVLFLVLLATFGGMLLVRLFNRQDVPPPSFVLVLLALGCAGAGALISILTRNAEDAFFQAALQHLLVYQGFILLPILGVGAFLLPRFFGLPSRQNFPESRTPPPGWWSAFFSAAVAGLAIVVSFWMEAAGWVRGGPALRLLATLAYLVREVPVHRRMDRPSTAASVLRLAFLLVLAGFLAIVLFPAYRISLLHLTLVGGFAIVTFTVATRVIYGHSGNSALLQGRNRWLWAAVGLMVLAMATRISGDLWPKVMISHYNYGAAVWIVAVLLWAIYVLPKVLVPDPED